MILLFRIFAFLLAPMIFAHAATANPIVRSHGVFKLMVHKKQAAGVVTLKDVLPHRNIYAVGAIENGMGRPG